MEGQPGSNSTGQDPGVYPEPAAQNTESRRGGRWRWWVVGGLGLVGLTCVSLVALAVVFGPRLLRQGQEGLRVVQAPATGYYNAVKANNFELARGYLGADLREENSAARLREAWARREQAYGEVDRFDTDGTHVRTATATGTTATVSGTLRYAGGQEERKVLTLAQEGGEWKLTALP